MAEKMTDEQGWAVVSRGTRTGYARHPHRIRAAPAPDTRGARAG
ncbi:MULTISPECIES: hypothetical protein [Streptomyces]|nr:MULTISPECIES: hypothetical protein [Streptomyces]